MSGLNTVLQRTELLKSVAVFAPVPEPVAAFERARNMADDKTKKARDRNRIDVHGALRTPVLDKEIRSEVF